MLMHKKSSLVGGRRGDKTNYTLTINKISLRFSISKRRLLYLAFGVVAFLIAYSVGASLQLTDEESRDLSDQFAERIAGIDEFGIFLNNLWIALAMFIPALGAGFGVFAGFSTGAVFTAISESQGLGDISPLLIFITPFGVMELFVYGLAMSRSGILIVRLVREKPWRAGYGRLFYEKTLVPTFIELGIVVVVLFAAALIEWWFIEQFGGLDSNLLIEPV